MAPPRQGERRRPTRRSASCATRTAREVGEAEAAIFDAHLLLLDDAALLDDVRGRIDGGLSAASAWAAAIADLAAEFAAVPDPYLRARAEDVTAVGDQVLRAMLGRPRRPRPRSGVLVAADLTPAEAAELDPRAGGGRVAGIRQPARRTM